PSPGQIVFTRGATEALNLLAYGLEHRLVPGDDIVISALEHHANLLPWQQLALRAQARLVILPLDARGEIDLDAATRLIGPRTRILAVSQLSNVLGRWQPLESLVRLARAQGAISVVDGAQGSVHGRHDLQALGCDFYAFSGHKLYGPDGVGVLYGRDGCLDLLRRWRPLESLVRMARAQGAISVVDGAQGSVHGRHDLQALGCDFYAFSGHKLYGPDGVGLLYGRDGCLDLLRPWQFGGETVRRADFHDADFHAAPMGLEAGTPPIAGVIGLGAALDYLASLDAQAVRRHEQALLEH